MIRQISNPKWTCSLFVSLSLLLAACAPSAAPQPYPIAPPYPGSNPNAIIAPTATRVSAPTPARSANSGTLTGRVTIGPLRPGPARVGETPQPIPPEVYAARTIQLFAADGKTLVTNVKINPDGTYSVDLPTGNYVVNLARTGIDRAQGLPKNITIEAGKTIQLDIDIDTGIR